MVDRVGRLRVGPLALVAFFLPWSDGPGVLSQETYSGFELVGFAGRLQALDLAPSASLALWSVRMLILGVAIAAAWHAVLAALARWHLAYPLSGWYVVAGAAVAAGIGLYRVGLELPPAGLGLWLLAATLFVALQVRGWVANDASPSQ